MSGLSLITCTGGRPEAFALCERWMSRQTYRGPLQWIVVDDCDPATPCTMGQEIIRPRPAWQPGQNTQHRNMLAALEAVKHEKVLVIEDDDYFAPRYLEVMASRLDDAVMAGERRCIYYHVGGRGWHDCQNLKHSSLFQTGFRAQVIPTLRRLCQRGFKWLDIELWKATRGVLYSHTGLTVGIKGLPGRAGIGVGHGFEGWMHWVPDPDLARLREIIGADAEAYAPYGEKAAAA